MLIKKRGGFSVGISDSLEILGSSKDALCPLDVWDCVKSVTHLSNMIPSAAFVNVNI